MKKTIRLARVLASTALSNGLAFVLAAVNSVLLTRLLGAEGRGEFAIFTTSSALFALLLSLGLDFALSYFVAQGRIPRQSILSAVVAYALSCSGLFYLLVVANNRLLRNEFFLPATKHEPGFEGLLAVLVFSALISANVRSVFAGARDFHAINVLAVGLSMGSVATFGTLYLLNNSGTVRVSTGGLFAAYTGLAFASSVITLLAAAIRLGLRWSWWQLEWGLVRQMLTVGLTAYVGMLLQFLNYRFDYWIVRHFTDLEALGVYSLASMLSQMLWLAPRSASGVLLSVYASGDRKDAESQALAGRLTLLASAIAGLAMGGLSGVVIPVLYGEDFRDAAHVLVLLLPGCIAFAPAIIWASGLAAKGLYAQNAWAAFWGFVVTVVLDVILIPPFHLTGAAVASSVSYLVSAAYVGYRFSEAHSVSVTEVLALRSRDLTAAWAAGKRILLPWTAPSRQQQTRTDPGPR